MEKPKKEITATILDSFKEDLAKRPFTVRISFIIAVICTVLAILCIILEESNMFSSQWNNAINMLRITAIIIGIIALVYISCISFKSMNK